MFVVVKIIAARHVSTSVTHHGAMATQATVAVNARTKNVLMRMFVVVKIIAARHFSSSVTHHGTVATQVTGAGNASAGRHGVPDPKQVGFVTLAALYVVQLLQSGAVQMLVGKASDQGHGT